MEKTRVTDVVAFNLLASTSMSCGAVPDDTATSEQALSATPEAATVGWKVTFVAPARPARTTDERRHLLYELVVENTGPTPATIVSLAAVSVGGGARVTHVAGDALARGVRLDRPAGAAGDGGRGRTGCVLSGRRLAPRLRPAARLPARAHRTT